jgi:Amt family ammonium transporter
MILLVAVAIILPFASFAQDPSGAKTGNLGDIDTSAVKVLDTVSKAKDTSVANVSKSISRLSAAVSTIGDASGHNKIAINIVWTLLTGFLVMFMQAGFAMVETGFTQKKNVAHTMAMNFFIYALGVLGFWICGFAFMYGGR